MMRKFFRLPYLFIGICIILGSILSVIYMIYNGILIPNKLWIKSNDIIGCDVSRYQGDIEWDVLADQGLSFAFIKATEGSSHIDPKFEENWTNAQQTDLYLGAYHFFSFESLGQNQAEHFCQLAEKQEGRILPVVDVEFYGDFNEKNTNAAEIRKELDSFIQVIEKNYGKKPIIYTTKAAYNHLIRGYYSDCPLWIRSILTYPHIDREWSFWQYTNREQLPGYSGTEKYIDMNVFHGDMQDFMELLIE